MSVAPGVKGEPVISTLEASTIFMAKIGHYGNVEDRRDVTAE